jgi:sugar phosphate isomerase/epimerase
MLDQRVAVAAADFKLPLRKALHMAARLGARGVQIDALRDLRPAELSQTGLRQFRKMLDDLNLRVAAVRFPTRHGYYERERLDERIAATKRAMQFAHDLGARVVVNQVGRVPEDEQGDDWQTLTEALADLGTYGHRVGALLAAKTGSESGPDLARLLAALPEGTIGVDLDPGQLIVNGFSASVAADALAGRVLHVTASDAVRDLALGRGLEVQLGRGAADFPEFIARLEERGYHGWFTVTRRGADDPAREIGEGIEFLKSVGR